MYAIINRTDKRSLTIHGNSKKIKPGDSVLIRAYDRERGISSEKKQFTTQKFCGEFYDPKRKNKTKCIGYQATRVDNRDIYFEGKYRLPGNSKYSLITYDHISDEKYWIYVPAIEMLRGIPLPTVLKKIKIRDTIAWMQTILTFQQSVINDTQIKSQSQSQSRNNFKSSYSYEINHHSINNNTQQPIEEPDITDDDEMNSDSSNSNNNDNIGQQQQQNTYEDTFGVEDSINVDEFCQKQTEKFKNKSFKRKNSSMSRKIQTANKIIKQTEKKGIAKTKHNSRNAITWSAKAIFCARKEKGDTNKEAWNWCNNNKIPVGKSSSFCHKWDKGSAFWLRLIAENGADGSKLILYIIINK